MRLRTAFTADLAPDELEAVRVMVRAAFDDFDAEDWEHALGGMHVIAADDDGAPVGHACVVMRRLLHQGRALRCGYVESVATRADRRRQGIGDALMTEIGRLLQGAYDLGALGATEDGAPLYARHGWLPWAGPLRALTPTGVVDTSSDRDHVRVLPCAAPLDREAELTCDFRPGDLW